MWLNKFKNRFNKMQKISRLIETSRFNYPYQPLNFKIIIILNMWVNIELGLFKIHKECYNK